MVARLRFVPEPLDAAAIPDTELVIVTDTTWTGARTGRQIGLRELVEAVMTGRHLNEESTEALDRWADASGVVEAMTIEGVSFWYGVRLLFWLWLFDRLVFLGVVEDLLARYPDATEIVCDPEAEPSLAAAASLRAERGSVRVTAVTATTPPVTGDAPAAPAATPRAAALRSSSFVSRVGRRLRPPEPERRRGLVARRLRTIEADPVRRLLVVQAHVRQQIETPRGPRFINPYLGPVIDRLRGTRLDPFEVDVRTAVADDAAVWARLEGPDQARTLPFDVVSTIAGRPDGALTPREIARQRADAILAAVAPLPVSGVDLGPDLTKQVAQRVAGSLGRRIGEVHRIRAFLRRVHPAGILLADEYHRQDWLAAAAVEGVQVAAVQHGVISAWHAGYVHASRPPQLRLPARTYVFGSWERDLLVEGSTYRPDEVVVSGSPRLDLVEVTPGDTGAPAADDLRRQLGVAAGDRLVVLSGTWGLLQRRYHYPIALARLFDAPLDRVHVVVKLHPSEKDEGPYRAIIEGLAATGGFAPPPITIVQSIDLYRLLAVADAHLGIHSTLLTEAVATGTPNLLAAGLASADLLGYVDAGVAVPVRNGADILVALDRPRAEIMRDEDREAFLRAHFEPGDASGRIADDLLGWMA